MIDICAELHQNAIDFAYESNSARAFADARDGLKPGQRACLWEMYSKGYSSNKPHVKSAKIDGGVAATWWPHGTTAIYETFARMSQPWINNIPEVDWHGANGNQIIGSSPAADRYTEARLSKAIEDGMFSGIKKSNVPMILNFSEDEEWPEVLPAIMPRLLVNGCQGIGYTVANVWIPHNLKEAADLITEYLETGELNIKNFAPDFPSGGIIINKNELSSIYTTGKGKVILRGKTEIKGNSIFITELPYQVYVEPLLDEIRELYIKDEITGIKEIYNKCDKKHLLIEIECNESPEKVLNQLFKLTNLQKSYSANQYALVSKTPKLLNLKEYLDIYIQHNISCIVKEYEHDLAKAKARLEIVDGLLKALEDIDNIIGLIKNSESSAKAKIALIEKYSFTENQAKAILDMRLSKLAHLEKIELNQESKELHDNVASFQEILNKKERQVLIFEERLKAFANKYGSARKSELIQIQAPAKEDNEIAYVEPEKCVVVMTEAGGIKRIPITSFRTQKKGGKGVKTQDEITSAVIRTNTIDSLMVFSNQGKMYRLLVNDIPAGTNTSKCTPIKSLISMETNEKPTIIYSIYRDTDAKYVMFVTKNGLVKKTGLKEYIDTKKKTGVGAIVLKEGDELAAVTLIKDEQLLLLTHNGNVIKFSSSEVAATSRMTSGVKGIGLNEGDYVVAALPIRNSEDDLAVFSSSGLGKRIKQSDILSQKRGGKGVSCFKGATASEYVVTGQLVNDEDSVLIIGNQSSICVSAKEIPVLGRTCIGNILAKAGKVSDVSKI